VVTVVVVPAVVTGDASVRSPERTSSTAIVAARRNAAGAP
jgi:hypothetical protein